MDGKTMGLPPFIITLATLTSLRGIGLLITNGATINIVNDTFTESGDYEKLLAKYGLSAGNIVAHAEKVLKRKG